jgi:hypothetical protein
VRLLNDTFDWFSTRSRLKPPAVLGVLFIFAWLLKRE